MLAVVDCNNFFVSCERVFRPHLENKPVAVLSNNDGCVVARSQETKKLGIPMGIPYFKVKHIFQEHRVTLFSGNFSLYGDISNRVMRTIIEMHPDVEIYSIDEAFLNLATLPTTDYAAFAHKLSHRIKQWTGIPVSVGIAPTKTLAKAANEYAKTHPEYEGVCNLSQPNDWEDLLRDLPVEDVWGIGYKLSYFLKSQGIFTAGELAQQPLAWVRQHLHVGGERTVLELRGIPCIRLHQESLVKKGIISSRSFGTMVDKLEDLAEAVAVFTARAAEKLRDQNSVTSMIGVSIATNRHRHDQRQYFNSYSVALPNYTNDTRALISAAHEALKAIYLPNFLYKRALVFINHILPVENIQYSLLHSRRIDGQTEKLMTSVDGINTHWGQDTIYVASMYVERNWKPLQQKRSAAFTTRWNDILKVRTLKAP